MGSKIDASGISQELTDTEKRDNKDNIPKVQSGKRRARSKVTAPRNGRGAVIGKNERATNAEY